MPCFGKRSTPENAMYETYAFAKTTPESDFQKIKIKRGVTGPNDVEFDIKYCGICHSDVHTANNDVGDIMPTNYPCVPGHELAGIVIKVGFEVPCGF